MVLTESDYLEFQLYFQNKSLPRRVQINLLSKSFIITSYFEYNKLFSLCNIVGNCVSANGNDIKAIHVMKSKQVLLI